MTKTVRTELQPKVDQLLSGDTELTIEQAAIISSIDYHLKKGHYLTVGERNSVERIYQEVYHD